MLLPSEQVQISQLPPREYPVLKPILLATLSPQNVLNA